MSERENASWSGRMDADAPIAEPIDDTTVCANLRKQASQINDLTNRINAVSRSEIYFSHDPIIQQGLLKNMCLWQQELERLKEQVSELCCPVVNCASHNPNSNKNSAKRPLSETSVEISSSKIQTKTAKNPSEKPFVFPPKRHTAKPIIQSNFLKGTNRIINDSNLCKNLATIDDDAGIRPQIPPPPIMLRKTVKFAHDLKLINDEFGEVEAKSGGLFIKLFTNNPEQHIKPTKFLNNKNLEYFVFTPKWLRPIKVVIKSLPWESKLTEIKSFLEEIHKLKIEKVVQLTSLRTQRPLRLSKSPYLTTKISNKSGK
ncbi:hypothetical protein AVEN_132516-1 [Araneus ventricosus]|uniref:Pre-C2HC domain-containing protein n=1 Tax=Araneus ventricosus TaxID=182803 RepID=A0A4Y2S1I0_ARAVE|nr:hypothetical protein AVEN_132516-1 [Araneus ventricosus]